MKTEKYSELERKIEDQRRGQEGTPAWMIGQQLLDMAAGVQWIGGAEHVAEG